MYLLLSGVRTVDAALFIAAPSCALCAGDTAGSLPLRVAMITVASGRQQDGAPGQDKTDGVGCVVNEGFVVGAEGEGWDIEAAAGEDGSVALGDEDEDGG